MTANEHAAAEPQIIGPDDGVELSAGPVQLVLKVTSEHSDRFTLLDYRVPPGFAAPPALHHHTREDWAAHVTAGALTFTFADQEIRADAGTTVFVPAGCDFAWRNAGDDPARFLAAHAPAGFDRFFVDVADGIADEGGTPSPETMQRVVPPLWGRYGIEPRDADGPA